MVGGGGWETCCLVKATWVTKRFEAGAVLGLGLAGAGDG